MATQVQTMTVTDASTGTTTPAPTAPPTQIPAWATTLKAHSFQYLLKPHLAAVSFNLDDLHSFNFDKATPSSTREQRNETPPPPPSTVVALEPDATAQVKEKANIVVEIKKQPSPTAPTLSKVASSSTTASVTSASPALPTSTAPSSAAVSPAMASSLLAKKRRDQVTSSGGSSSKNKKRKPNDRVTPPSTKGNDDDDDDTPSAPRPYGTRRPNGPRKVFVDSYTSEDEFEYYETAVDEKGSLEDEDGMEDEEEEDSKGPIPQDHGTKWDPADDALLLQLGARFNGETWREVKESFPRRTIRGVKQRWRNLLRMNERGERIELPPGYIFTSDVNGTGQMGVYFTDDSMRGEEGDEDEGRLEDDVEDEEMGVEDDGFDDDDQGLPVKKDGRGAQGAKWTQEDDVKLLSLTVGRRNGDSWADIAAAFPDRPANSAKQRWQRLTRKGLVPAPAAVVA